MYEIPELLDHRNQALYDRLTSQASIELRESDDEFWGEIVRDGIEVISCAPSNIPVSCFTHELLHVEQNQAGSARPTVVHEALSQEIFDQQGDVIDELVPYAYNHLIHHKMFPRFLELGFPAKEFLIGGNGEDRLKVKQDVQKLKKRSDHRNGVPFHVLVFPFLWANSPDDTSKETQAVLKDIRNASKGADFYQAMALLKRLKSDSRPDMSFYLAHICRICGLPNIGFGPDEDHLIWARDCLPFVSVPPTPSPPNFAGGEADGRQRSISSPEKPERPTLDDPPTRRAEAGRAPLPE